MKLKTYEEFSLRNIFKKNYKNALISAIVDLTKQVFKYHNIIVKDNDFAKELIVKIEIQMNIMIILY